MNYLTRPPSWKLPRAIQGSLREGLIRAGAEVQEDSKNQWRVRLPVAEARASVTLHANGTCWVAGPASAVESAAEMVRSTILEASDEAFLDDLVTKARVTLPVGPHIGCDESGKSDFFGPIVTAAVHADGELIKWLCALGVRDCKDLSDVTVQSLAAELHQVVGERVAVTYLPPERYNDLYARFKYEGKNLNDLLASAHARCIKDLLARGLTPTSVLVDRFAFYPRETLAQATRGEVPILEAYEAEADFAVAAASIVARARFLDWMDATSERLGIALPKGTSQGGKVVDVAREIVDRDGKESLKSLAKMNVSTIQNVFARRAEAAPPARGTDIV
jgi:ribonuclease HIII